MSTDKEQERLDWLKARTKYITASDMGPVLGLSPHKTRKKVFEEKVGLCSSADIDRLPIVMAGKFLEAGIIAWHKEHRGFDGYVWGSPEREGTWFTDHGLLPHPTSCCVAATPDAIIWSPENPGKLWPTEVKNVKHDKPFSDWAKTWKSGGSSNIPEAVVLHADRWTQIDPAKLRAPVYYWAQLQVQMSCLGIPRGRVVVCFGGQARADLDYTLDVSFERHMLSEAERFWTEVEAARELRGWEQVG